MNFRMVLVGAGTLGIATGATALAIGLALTQAGHSLFGIGGTEYTVAGAVAWANGVVLLVHSRRTLRRPPATAVPGPLS